MTDTMSRPADFDTYWDAVDRELAQYPAAPTLERLALPSDEHSTVYGVKLTSIGRFSLSAEKSGGALAFLKRLRGSGKDKNTTAGHSRSTR